MTAVTSCINQNVATSDAEATAANIQQYAFLESPTSSNGLMRKTQKSGDVANVMMPAIFITETPCARKRIGIATVISPLKHPYGAFAIPSTHTGSFAHI